MRYLSVCSGIEAATAAWHPLGWTPVAFSEVDAFPSAVLAHHYPTVPNYGDMTKFQEWPDATFDVLVGGTPCQSFSVAGLRAGLDDPRGNLMLVYLALARRYRPRWLVWENVPGVLSSNGGRDFGTFLGGLAELGYGFAYRVLDAQYFGLAQRRKRVFVVGHLGSWQRAAAVLFECASLSGHPAPRREAGQVAPTVPRRRTAGGGLGTDFDCDGGLIASTGDISHCLNAGGMGRQDYETETLIAHSLKADGFDASEDGTGRGTPLAPVVSSTLQATDGGMDSDRVGQLVPISFEANMSNSADHAAAGYMIPVAVGAVAFDARQSDVIQYGVMPAVALGTQMSTPHWQHDLSDTLQAKNPKGVAQGMAVRRLTPLECCRLQGFPDTYLDIPYRGKPAADGPRYKALGNSMAVPCMHWIGKRIHAVENIR